MPAPRDRNPFVRTLYVIMGCVCVGLGIVGAFLPVLPTTPFMLLGAACFTRGSERAHGWLVANRVFGPSIRSWERHRTVPVRARRHAIAMMAAMIGLSCWLVDSTPVRIVLVIIASSVSIFLWRLPPHPDDAGSVISRPATKTTV